MKIRPAGFEFYHKDGRTDESNCVSSHFGERV